MGEAGSILPSLQVGAAHLERRYFIAERKHPPGGDSLALHLAAL